MWGREFWHEMKFENGYYLTWKHLLNKLARNIVNTRRVCILKTICDKKPLYVAEHNNITKYNQLKSF